MAALLLISVPAQADAIFDFSFSNVTGSVSGTVSGTITLSGTGDGTFSATSILVNAAPAALGYTVPFDVFTAMPVVNINTFVDSGGQIDKFNSEFASMNIAGTMKMSLNVNPPGTSLELLSGHVEDSTSSTLSYSSPAAVPEPSTAFALAAVCGVTGCLRRMRRSA